MIVCIILMCLGVIALTFFLIEKVKKYSVKAVFIKSVASLLFISLATYCYLSKTLTIMGLCFILALVCGLLGDIFLDLKYVYREDDKPYTYAGFIAFSIGHIFYVTGLYTQYFNNGHVLYIIIPAVLSVLVGIGNVFLGKLIKQDYKDMKFMVGLYSTLLFFMLSSAFSLWMLHGFNSTTLLMIFIGGVLFAISDFILGGTYFGVNRERPIDIISNSVTYYAAQNIIAFSLFFVVI